MKSGNLAAYVTLKKNDDCSVITAVSVFFFTVISYFVELFYRKISTVTAIILIKVVRQDVMNADAKLLLHRYKKLYFIKDFYVLK